MKRQLLSRNNQVNSEDRYAPESATGGRRFFVRAGNEHIPLFKEMPVLDSCQSPWSGIIVEKHHHTGCEIPVHDHETLCLHLQTCGEVDMDWFWSGKSGRQRSIPGSMMLLPAGTRDSVIWHGSTKRIVVGVEPGLLKDAAEEMGVRGLLDFRIRWALRDPQLEALMTEMNREMKTGWLLGALYGDLLSMALSVSLIRKYAEVSPYSGRFKGGLSQGNLNRVLSYIEENLNLDIRLEELAQLSGLSRYHFARSFKESVGESPYQYTVRRRIERAKSLLLLPGATIAEVGKKVGFSDASQFSRTFRKVTGVTPLAWRKGV